MKLDKNPTIAFKKEVDAFLQDSHQKGLINQLELRFLTKDFPVIPVMYALPKVHRLAQKPPGRPIVASNDCLMEPISQYVDHVLRPLVESLPSYLKDIADFLINFQIAILMITRRLSLVVFLSMVDVVSLYTNIPHNKGIVAIKYKNKVPQWVPNFPQTMRVYLWDFKKDIFGTITLF